MLGVYPTYDGSHQGIPSKALWTLSSYLRQYDPKAYVKENSTRNKLGFHREFHGLYDETIMVVGWAFTTLKIF